MARTLIGLVAALLALSACWAAAPARSVVAPQPGHALPVAVQSTPLGAPMPCSGTFVAHDLDHVTTTPGATARMFEGNGSGVAIDDLDGDRRPEIVLANSYGANTILWNQGGLAFRTERMPQGDSRAVNLWMSMATVCWISCLPAGWPRPAIGAIAARAVSSRSYCLM